MEQLGREAQIIHTDLAALQQAWTDHPEDRSRILAMWASKCDEAAQMWVRAGERFRRESGSRELDGCSDSLP
jgi:hypothetical protein